MTGAQEAGQGLLQALSASAAALRTLKTSFVLPCEYCQRNLGRSEEVNPGSAASLAV